MMDYDERGAVSAEGVSEQGVEENICDKEGWSNGRVKKAA
jgi:hypothetical protein